MDLLILLEVVRSLYDPLWLMSCNKQNLLWQQTLTWSAISTIFVADFFTNSNIVCCVLPSFFSAFVVACIGFAICVFALANGVYSLILYLFCVASNDRRKDRKVSILSCSNSFSPQVSATIEKSNCLVSICTFLDNFFKSSIMKGITSDHLNTSINSSFNGSGFRSHDTSLSSTVGYHDSPHNRSVSSIYTPQQLEKLIANETCDSVTADSTTNTSLFSGSFCDEDRLYKSGTPFTTPEKTDDAATRILSEIFYIFYLYFLEVKQFIALKQRASQKKIVSDFKRTFDFSSNKFPSSGSSVISSSGLSTGGGRHTVRHHETDLIKVFKHYNIDPRDLDEYEMKLRIWICNTIFRPLVEKVDETNQLLSSKFSFLHLKVGSSTPDVMKSSLASKPELCNTFLPFILPYLSIHSNQNYLVQRIRRLSENVALEDFKWNAGGSESVRDENEGITKTISWSERFPTDSELVWHAFCVYMDFHLAPCPNYATGDFFKPFSNVYFVKGDSQLSTLHASPDSFFIRLAAESPPVFELVLNGGNDVIVPNRDCGNLWLILLLFIAHVDKHNNSRIGPLHLSSTSLDILAK